MKKRNKSLESAFEMIDMTQDTEEERLISEVQGKNAEELALGSTFTPSQYRLNIFKMTVMWCAVSFSCHMLTFMNKFLEGSIYRNSYIDGFAGALASFIGTHAYIKLGMRRMFIISFTLAIIGGFMIYSLESGKVQLPTWYLASFVDGHLTDKTPKLTKKATIRAVDYLVPQITFIAKFGVHLAFLCTYTASFSNDKIFPSSIRTSAIG